MREQNCHPSNAPASIYQAGRFLTAICLLLCGCCDYQHPIDKEYAPEDTSLNVKEHKISYFFSLDQNFNLPDSELLRMLSLLQVAKGNGVGNIGFTLMSGKPIPLQLQEKARKQILRAMYRCGFPNSRIIDSGACVYRDAKTGIRMDILKYEATMTDCDKWSEDIGDINTNKSIPKFGASASYNLREMIFNSADIIAPRKYKGMKADSLIPGQGNSGGLASGGAAK
ncbi:MAG: CpaD family pilus assembly lipoprotein [Holosporaceae bacterium]|jgi:type IV pilus biogenesis protein CpaD/CtpE|nr:CpaD family pilus assembly lipoprotein [Holosporaceae bacterium]